MLCRALRITYWLVSWKKPHLQAAAAMAAATAGDGGSALPGANRFWASIRGGESSPFAAIAPACAALRRCPRALRGDLPEPLRAAQEASQRLIKQTTRRRPRFLAAGCGAPGRRGRRVRLACSAARGFIPTRQAQLADGQITAPNPGLRTVPQQRNRSSAEGAALPCPRPAQQQPTTMHQLVAGGMPVHTTLPRLPCHSAQSFCQGCYCVPTEFQQVPASQQPAFLGTSLKLHASCTQRAQGGGLAEQPRVAQQQPQAEQQLWAAGRHFLLIKGQ